jgi:hypothetical protein
MLHIEGFLDDLLDSRQRPTIGRKSRGVGAAFQDAQELPPLLWCQRGGTPWDRLSRQATETVTSQLVRPLSNRGAAHAEKTCNLGLLEFHVDGPLVVVCLTLVAMSWLPIVQQIPLVKPLTQVAIIRVEHQRFSRADPRATLTAERSASYAV